MPLVSVLCLINVTLVMIILSILNNPTLVLKVVLSDITKTTLLVKPVV